MRLSTHPPAWVLSRRTPKPEGTDVIPVYAPWLTELEHRNVMRCMEDTWISSKGTYVRELEEKFASYCGVPFAVATNCGTNAIFLALKAAGVKSGDEVIVPTFTMIATAFAVTYAGATPVFVDCVEHTGNIDVARIQAAISKKTRAIIPVHIYGTPCDMDEVHELAKLHALAVVEDAAEAYGATYKGRRIGGISELSAFSMYVNKVVTAGEGGMITLKSKRTYEYLKKLNNYFFSDIRHYWHEEVGYNFRMSNLEAAIGAAQVDRSDELVSKKRTIASWYSERLSAYADRLIPMGVPSDRKSNYWHIAYRVVDNAISVDSLRKYLAKRGIETRGFFIPLHMQPAYAHAVRRADFPVSELLARTGVLLPSGLPLTEAQVDRICRTVGEYLRK